MNLYLVQFPVGNMGKTAVVAAENMSQAAKVREYYKYSLPPTSIEKIGIADRHFKTGDIILIN